jgi:hypothetical protein
MHLAASTAAAIACAEGCSPAHAASRCSGRPDRLRIEAWSESISRRLRRKTRFKDRGRVLVGPDGAAK